MVFVDHNGDAKPLYLHNLQNEEGKIPPSRVNIEGGTAQNYYSHICNYITEADYEATKKYVDNPEEYGFSNP